MIVLLLVIIRLSIYKFTAGESIERDEIIAATTWKLQQEGYKKEDISSIKSRYDFMTGVLPYKYDSEVIFKDESEARYYYGWNDKNKNFVNQSGYSGDAKKHKK
ncbi:uncharacterized protein DUF3139 [Aneurinibacillus soli]|uniref:Uncharacterized protein n=1 Tax=Aneurinibacillus soli TaxID=1500254 RepID=A0A0U4WMZ7_9BACL|nr:uncharacterized protein DUF3139 [Aneurinibacillus soli]BAU29640.1 hypothetical protein CB4_03877 [Aneurinibacillus soli]